MNDDFLRRMRRPPSAAFERQLRVRLQEQELGETSRHRPSWRLLAIALLIGGSALATATYLTLTRTPSLPSPPTHTESTPTPSVRQAAPDTNRWIIHTPTDAKTSIYTISPPPTPQQESPINAARPNNQSPAAATDGSKTETNRYVSSTGPGAAATTRPLRIVATPDIAALTKDTTAEFRYIQSASLEVDSADAALPTLCADEEQARPDIVLTSRPARREEFRLCKRRYTGKVLETTLGHIAIVVTRAKTSAQMQLSTQTLRLALLKQVPAPDNSAQLIDNPYTHWNQIDPSLEERRIEVLGPAPDTPEFAVFASIVLAPACENNASLDQQLCQSVRADGVYSEVRFDADFVRQRLWSDPNAVAVMEYRFYAANADDLLGSLLLGPAPTRESIVSGNYVGARTVHAYVNGDRYRQTYKVRMSVNEYLRLPAFLQSQALIPPDDSFDWRRPYNDGPKLTEVKLD